MQLTCVGVHEWFLSLSSLGCSILASMLERVGSHSQGSDCSTYAQMPGTLDGAQSAKGSRRAGLRARL